MRLKIRHATRSQREIEDNTGSGSGGYYQGTGSGHGGESGSHYGMEVGMHGFRDNEDIGEEIQPLSGLSSPIIYGRRGHCSFDEGYDNHPVLHHFGGLEFGEQGQDSHIQHYPNSIHPRRPSMAYPPPYHYHPPDPPLMAYPTPRMAYPLPHSDMYGLFGPSIPHGYTYVESSSSSGPSGNPPQRQDVEQIITYVPCGHAQQANEDDKGHSNDVGEEGDSEGDKDGYMSPYAATADDESKTATTTMILATVIAEMKERELEKDNLITQLRKQLAELEGKNEALMCKEAEYVEYVDLLKMKDNEIENLTTTIEIQVAEAAESAFNEANKTPEPAKPLLMLPPSSPVQPPSKILRLKAKVTSMVWKHGANGDLLDRHTPFV